MCEGWRSFIIEATVEGLFTLGPPGWSRDERSSGPRILNILRAIALETKEAESTDRALKGREP